MTVNQLINLDILVAGVVAEDDVGHRDSKWVFEGGVAKKTSKSGGNGVAKKTSKSGGNGVCWVKADDSGRFCINYEGR